MSARKGRQPVDGKILFKYSAVLICALIPAFQWGSCYLIFSFLCMFYRSLFVHLYFFFWPLCCLFFFDIQILITSLLYLQTLLTQILHVCSFYIDFLHCINLQIYKMDYVLTPLYMTSGLFLNYLLLSMTLFPWKPCNYNNNNKMSIILRT